MLSGQSRRFTWFAACIFLVVIAGFVLRWQSTSNKRVSLARLEVAEVHPDKRADGSTLPDAADVEVPPHHTMDEARELYRLRDQHDMIRPPEFVAPTVLSSDQSSTADRSLVLADHPSAEDWPAYRGDGTGCTDHVELEPDWEKFPPQVCWRQKIAGSWSSPIIVGEAVICMEQVEQREMLVGRHLSTGKTAWQVGVPGYYQEGWTGFGPRATPVYAGGRLVGLTSQGVLFTVDPANKQLRWTIDLAAQYGVAQPLYGYVASPLVVGNKVVVALTGDSGPHLVAIGLQDGKEIWRANAEPGLLSSPQHFVIHEVGVIAHFATRGLALHAADTGRLLALQPWITNPPEFNNVGQPIFLPPDSGFPARLIIASGYGQGTACFDVRPTEGNWSLAERWRSKSLKPKFSSLVRAENLLFGFDETYLVCLDAVTGSRYWKSQRVGFGQLVRVGRHLIAAVEDGTIRLVAVSSSQYREVARFPVLSDRSWSSPAFSRGMLLHRNDRELVAVKLPTRPIGRPPSLLSSR